MVGEYENSRMLTHELSTVFQEMRTCVSSSAQRRSALEMQIARKPQKSAIFLKLA